MYQNNKNRGSARARADDTPVNLFTTVNTSPRKKQVYKNKVIKDIINRRVENVIEVNKHDYGLYDKAEALERIR